MNNILLRHCHRHLQTRIRYSAGARISTKTTATALTTASTTTATTTFRSFSSNNDNNKPKKLSEDEIKASLRLLSYQGTPFPWAAVSLLFCHVNISFTVVLVDQRLVWNNMLLNSWKGDSVRFYIIIMCAVCFLFLSCTFPGKRQECN